MKWHGEVPQGRVYARVRVCLLDFQSGGGKKKQVRDEGRERLTRRRTAKAQQIAVSSALVFTHAAVTS